MKNKKMEKSMQQLRQARLDNRTTKELFYEGMWSWFGGNYRREDQKLAISLFRKCVKFEEMGEVTTYTSDAKYILDIVTTRKRNKFTKYLKEENIEDDPRALYFAAMTLNPKIHYSQRAHRLIKRSADKGYALAQSMMSYLYLCFDYRYYTVAEKECLEYAKKSADQDDPLGLFMYAEIHAHWNGMGEQVAIYFEKSADNHWVDAMDRCLYYDSYLCHFENPTKKLFWSASGISKSKHYDFIERYTRILNNIDVNVCDELIYTIGQTMFFYVYDSDAWNSMARLKEKKKGYRCMELYYEWCTSAKNATLCFLCICKYSFLREFIPRDVAQIIGKLVWNSRTQPTRNGKEVKKKLKRN